MTLVFALLPYAVRLLAATWRVERPPWPIAGPCVAAFWHGEQLPIIALHRDLPMVGLASLSRDGERLARVIQGLGYRVIRGSTSRGGVAALRAARAALQAGGWPAFAVDGPRGPAGVPQPGAAALARMERVPVVFGRIEAPGWRLSTWDRFLVPYPFARVRVRYTVWRPEDGPLEAAVSAP